MIDILSGGRVVCGFVRGLGQESIATNVNPIYNRERFDEAHNVIVKAWTTPGPFRWEGRHYEYRVVNPWIRPLQKPHPPIWIPGVVSPESVRWAAEHRYPYVALAPPLTVIDEIYDLYDEVAARTGFTIDLRAPRLRHPGERRRHRREGLRGGPSLLLAAGDVLRRGAAPLAAAARIREPRGDAEPARARPAPARPTSRPVVPAISYEEAHATYQIVSGKPRHRDQEAAAHHRRRRPGLHDFLGPRGADVPRRGGARHRSDDPRGHPGHQGVSGRS